MSVQTEKFLKFLQIGITVFIFLASTVFSIIGYLVVNKISSIDDSLKEINSSINVLNKSDSDKAARIQNLEDAIRKHDEIINKKLNK